MTQEKLHKMLPNGITLDGAVKLGRAILITAHDDLLNSYDTIQKIRVKHRGKITKDELDNYMEKIWELQRNEHFYKRQDGMFKVLIPRGEGQRVIDMIRKEANYCYDDEKFIKRCENLWQKEIEKQRELERKRLERERAKKEAFINSKKQEVLGKIEKTLNSNNVRLIKSLKTKLLNAIVDETNLAKYFTEQENREHIKMINDKLEELQAKEGEKNTIMSGCKSYKTMTLHELIDERNRVLLLIKNANYSKNPVFTIKQNKKYLGKLEKKIKEII